MNWQASWLICQDQRFDPHPQAWDGKDPGLGRHWIEQAMTGLDETSKAIGRLVLLTALAPYQADESVVRDFVTRFPEDEKLLGALAWSSLTAARRIGTWLYAPLMKWPDLQNQN